MGRIVWDLEQAAGAGASGCCRTGPGEKRVRGGYIGSRCGMPDQVSAGAGWGQEQGVSGA